MEEKKAAITVNGILRQIEHSHMHLELKKALRIEVNKPTLYSGDIKKHLKKFLKESGYSIRIQNFIYKAILERNETLGSTKQYKEPLGCIRTAQESWQKCIVKSINSMCTELSLPLSRMRSNKQKQLLADRLESMQLGLQYNDEAYSKLRPVYSSVDFFEVIVGIRNPNTTFFTDSSWKPWGMMQVGLSTHSQQVREEFDLLTGTHPQIGIDDLIEGSFASDWKKVGEKVISRRHVGASRQYLKQGCPAGLRKQLWKTLFDIDVSDEESRCYEKLKEKVLDYDMLVDYLIMKDVRLTATNDDSFFVFEDVLHQIMLVFSRDTWMIDQFKHFSAEPPKSRVRGKPGMDESSVIYPPCGVFPFHGFSMLVAPLCYTYDKPVELYYVFRTLYSRYFYQLCDISSHPQGITSICCLFEELLQCDEPQVFKHLLDINARPLQIVFSWFLFAFSGYLATDETLQLWDRVIGFNSLRILAVLAVAIISYRRENLISVTTASGAVAVLADISTIKVIPVLVHYLSGRKF